MTKREFQVYWKLRFPHSPWVRERLIEQLLSDPETKPIAEKVLNGARPKLKSGFWVLAMLLIGGACWAGIGFEQREGRWWIIWTNTPPKFLISSSDTLGTNWTPYLRKESGEALGTLELMLPTTNITNEIRFWKMEALP